MKKKYEKIMHYFLVFIMVFSYISPIYGMFDVYAEGEEIPNNEFAEPEFPEVSSDKYTLKGLDLENNTLKVNVNESKVITLETEEDYYISSCQYISSPAYGYNQFVNTSREENSCTIDPYNYGKVPMLIQISNKNGTSSEDVKFYLDVEVDNYLDMVVNDIPDEEKGYDVYKYLKAGISLNNYHETCENDPTTGNRVCDIEFRYCHSDVDDTSKQVCITRPRTIKFLNYYQPTFSLDSNSVTLEIGNSKKIGFYNFTDRYENLLWVSENNDIASVDQNGKITAKGVGETLVKLYNKETFEYHTVTVTVVDDAPQKLEDIIEKLDNKSVTVDINHKNNVFNYYKYWDNGVKKVNPTYDSIVMDYVNKLLNNASLNSFNANSAKCNDNVCSLKITRWGQNSNVEEEYTINNLTVNLKGLNIDAFTNYNNFINSYYGSDGYLNINETFDFTYISYLDSNSEVILKYDKEYIAKEEETNMYKAIKSGYTEIEVITDGYSDKIGIYIYYDHSYQQELSDYVNSIKTITLPYNSLGLSSKTDLKYLENIVGNKLLSDYPNSEIKHMLQSEVSCLSSNICNFKIYVKKNYTALLGDANVDRIVKVNFEEEDTDTVNEIKKIDSLIKNYYIIPIYKTIGLKNSLDVEEWFYDSLIENTELVTIKANAKLDVEFVRLNTFKINPYIKGGVKYLVKISKDNTVLFTKEVTITADHVVEMAANLNVDDRSDYLKRYVDSTLNINNSSNKLIYDNIYEVTVGEKTFNLILDQKDYVNITQVDVVDKLFELKTGESKQIKYKTWPENGTSYEKIEFKSDDEKIATVDSTGVIRGVSKGYTYVDVKLNGSTSRILVTVDMPVKEALNSYLHFIEDEVIIDYSNLRYNSVEQALKNEIGNNFYEYDYWLPFQASIKQENGKYYAAVGYNTTYIYGGDMVTSDYKEISYRFEGIKVDEYVYNLNTGDVVDTKLSFTEGDNNNLYFSYEREGVVELSKDGKLKALKPGISNVYINDKYNKYWNYITVIVDFDKYFDSVSQDLQTNKIRVNSLDYRNNMTFKDIVNNKLYERFPIHSLNRIYDLTCDEINLECTYTIYKTNASDSGVDKEVTFEIIKEGIFLDKTEDLINIGEERDISYTVLNDNEDDVKIRTLNPDVCKIENNKIIGESAGLCNIKYESKKNLAYQHIIVGKNEIITAYETALMGINDGLEVPLLEFDYNNHNFSDMGFLEYNIGVLPINNKIKQLINLDTDFDVWAGRTEEEDENRYNNMEITISPNLHFQDEKNMYYYSYYDPQFNISKEVDITPVEINKDDLKIGTKIKEQVKDKYKLTMLQYLRLRLAGKTYGLMEYSDFYELVKKECPTCTISFGEGGMGGADDGSIHEGGTYVVFKDYNPIATFELTFEASIDVLQSGEIFDEDDYINLIKDIVRDAYLKARKELTGVSRMSTRSINTRKLNDDIEVDVKKEFDPTNGQSIYVVTVDDITFKTTAKTETTVKVNYTYSVTNLQLSDSNLTLNKGQSKVIGYSVTPDNATNKEVKFESSNNNVVTVDENGTVIATGAGTATITVTTKDGSNISKQVSITVTDNSSNEEIKVLLGDINVDGKINMNDLITLRKYFAGNVTLSKEGLKNADITKDGKTNMNDLIALRKFLAN